MECGLLIVACALMAIVVLILSVKSDGSK